MSNAPAEIPRFHWPLILLAFVLSVIFAMPAVVSLYQNSSSSDWFFVPVEIPLPASNDIKAVEASIEADNVVVYESTPRFELPHDIGLRLVDCLRPIMTAKWDRATRGGNKKISPLKLKITTNDGSVFEVDVYADIGLQRAIMIFQGQECRRGGELYHIGYLWQPEGGELTRIGDSDEGLMMRGIVREVFDSLRDHGEHAISIDEMFLSLEASTGRRPVEELDKWREDHPPASNVDE